MHAQVEEAPSEVMPMYVERGTGAAVAGGMMVIGEPAERSRSRGNSHRTTRIRWMFACGFAI